MRQPPQWLLFLLNRFAWLLSWLSFGLFFRVIRRGRENLPRSGGVLVVSNHVSFLDPPLLNIILTRIPHWLAMVELFGSPFWHWYFTNAGVIPVDRDQPGSAPLKEAIRRLNAGNVLVLFPEGGIHHDENSVLGGNPDIKPGGALIALKAKVPIMPAIIEGARLAYYRRNWFFRKQTIRLTFGKPFHLPERCDRDEALALIREKMLALAAEVKQEPLQPDLSGSPEKG